MDKYGFVKFLLFLAFIGLIIFAFWQDRMVYNETHDTFKEVYSKVGLFEGHSLSPLGPNEALNAELQGQYFNAFFVGGGEISGSAKDVLYLRFKWVDPSGAYKVKDFPYEKINFRIDEDSAPQMKFVFTKATLESELYLLDDLTVYDYNTFFDRAAAIDITISQELFDQEINKIKIKY